MYYMGYKLINKYAQFLYCHSEVNNGGNRTDTRRLLSGRQYFGYYRRQVEGIDFILFTRRNPTIQRVAASAGGRYPADADVAIARVGARRYCPSRSVSAGAAESGVFADRVRADIDARHRGDAPLGRAICRRMYKTQKTAAGISRFRRPLDQAFKTKSDAGIYSQRALFYNDDSQT